VFIDKALEVLRICVPVFALMGLGRILSARGIMSAASREFITGIAFYFSLPALIFLAIAKQPAAQLLNIPLILVVTTVVVLMAGGALLVSTLSGMRGAPRASCCIGTFWGNISYIGFPLSMLAFGADTGLAIAAVVNAVTTPVMLGLAYGIIAWSGRGNGVGFRDRFFEIFRNPVLAAVALAIVVACIGDYYRGANGVVALPCALVWPVSVVSTFLSLLGTMGLPLALISVGGALKMRALRGRTVSLVVAITGKLLLLPLLAFCMFKLFFPMASHTVVGVVVLILATPQAVASYVIMSRMGVDEEFVAASLAISTVGSIVSIPVWLYFLI